MDEKEPETSSSQKSETKDEKPAPRRSTRKKMNKVRSYFFVYSRVCVIFDGTGDFFSENQLSPKSG